MIPIARSKRKASATLIPLRPTKKVATLTASPPAKSAATLIPSTPAKTAAAPASMATKTHNASENGVAKPYNSMATGSSKIDPSRPEERYGIVDRRFYPPIMSNERCEMYKNNQIPRPIEVLESALRDTAAAREAIEVGDAVVHWYKRDLRIHDNRGLYLASEKARSKGVPLICMFIVSPQDYEAHMTSPPRVDFELRTLAIMKQDLAILGIPLFVETYEKRKTIPDKIIELWERWGAKHVFCNIEYEVDELRREASLVRKCLDKGISFTAVHDDVVVPPGRLMTGAGRQYAVYSPWYRTWIAHIHSDPGLLDAFELPSPNPEHAREKYKDIFEKPIPDAPANKSLSDDEKKRFRSLWPAGEHEGLDRLAKFLAETIGKYKDKRNFPAANSTAMISVHHSAGTVSARTSVRCATNVNSTKKLDGGNEGIVKWIGEVGWRDFYKHVLSNWPYICMNKPFKYEYLNIEWEYDDELFDKWCRGQTGFPFVDAAMRQLNYMGYMHNRCRMTVASFLAKDLLIDWRMGERYFMEHLIDGDFASNNGGWGFSASTGVDPQPFFRIFNPLLQSEKFDPEGEYIRKWVEELRDVKGKAVHDPYGRGAAVIAKQRGYPRPCVDHKVMRVRTLARYKEGLGRETANR